MSGNLTPDTAGALLQASQKQTALSANNLSHSKTMEGIEKTAKEFEAVFISAMLKPMFDGIETDGVFNGGKGEEIFRGMMLQEYGKMMSANGAVGIAADVKAKLIEIQGLPAEEPAPRPVAARPIDPIDMNKNTEEMDAIAVQLNNLTIGE